MSEGDCETKLIGDKPASEDAFNGAYSRVADAISNLILTSDGGATIGLRGLWGAGKSTVINFLKIRLETATKEDQETRVWIFDAWAHRGDLLRRAFLEHLFAYLSPEHSGWISEKCWNDCWKDRARTLGRKPVKSTSTVFTKPGLGAILLALSAALLPTGAALLSSGLSSVPYNPWLWVPGIIFILATPLIAVFYVLLNRRENPSASLYRDVTESDVVMSELPEPSTLEFEIEFKRVMNAVIGRNRRRFVIVVDNLDRVSETDAKNLIATLQIFFDFSENDADVAHWWRRIWIVLPYHPLLGEAIRSNGNDNGRTGAEMSGASLEAQLQKRIQLTFNVPPPVMSEWRNYLSSLLKEALPKHADKEDEHTNLYRILRSTKRNPTPRDIKTFVNNVGALHRQWGDEHGIEVLAYYEALRTRYSDPSRLSAALALGDEPGSGFLSILGGNDARRRLASVHFNVEKNVAEQLLLREPLENVMRKGSVSDFNTLAQRNPGLADVLDDMDFNGEGTNELANIGRVLMESSFADNQFATFRAHVTGNYQRAVLDTDWTEVGVETAQCVIHCAVLMGLKPAFTKVFDAFASKRETDAAGAARQWMEVVADAVIFAKNDGKANFFERKIALPSATAVLVAVCDELLAQKEQRDGIDDILSNLAVGDELDAKVASIAQNIESGNSTGAYLSAIKILVGIASNQSQEAVLRSISKRLADPSNAAAPEHGWLIRCLVTLWRKENLPTRDVLNELVQGAHIAESVGLLSNQGDLRSEAGMALWLWQQIEPMPVNRAGRPHAQVGRNWAIQILHHQVTDPAVTAAYADAVTECQAAEQLLSLWESHAAAQAFCVDVGQQLGPANQSFGDVTEEYLYDHWVALMHVLAADSYEGLIRCLCENGRMADYVAQQVFDESMCNLYVAIVANTERGDSPRFVKFLGEGIRQITTADWKQKIQNCNPDDPVIDLVAALGRCDIKLEGLNSYVMALSEYAASVGSGEIDSSNDTELGMRWRVLRGVLSAREDAILQKTLVEKAKEIGASLEEPFFALCLKDCDKQKIKDLRALLLELFEVLITGENGPGIIWIAQMMRDHSYIISRRGSAAQKYLKTAVQNALRREGQQAEATTDALQTIAKTMGVTIAEGSLET